MVLELVNPVAKIITPIQAVCDENITLEAEIPSRGQGEWSVSNSTAQLPDSVRRVPCGTAPDTIL